MQAVLITRGSRGMALFEPGAADRAHSDLRVGRNRRRDRRRRHGDGDVDARARGRRVVLEAARLANYAGGLVVMKRGTATVSRRRAARRGDDATRYVDRALVAGRSTAQGTPVVMLSRGSELVQAHRPSDRAAGRTVAFANGCFDLLHVGHIRYLDRPRGEADVSSSPSTTMIRCGR